MTLFGPKLASLAELSRQAGQSVGAQTLLTRIFSGDTTTCCRWQVCCSVAS